MLVVHTEKEPKLEKVCVRSDHIQLKSIIDKRLSYKHEAVMGGYPINYVDVRLTEDANEMTDFLDVGDDKDLVKCLEGACAFSKRAVAIESGLFHLDQLFRHGSFFPPHFWPGFHSLTL